MNLMKYKGAAAGYPESGPELASRPPWAESLRHECLALQLLLIPGEDLSLDPSPGFVVDGVGQVLEAPIGPLPAGHCNEHALIALDDLEPTDDKAVVQGDAHKGLELLIIPDRDSNFRDLHGLTTLSG